MGCIPEILAFAVQVSSTSSFNRESNHPILRQKVTGVYFQSPENPKWDSRFSPFENNVCGEGCFGACGRPDWQASYPMKKRSWLFFFVGTLAEVEQRPHGS